MTRLRRFRFTILVFGALVAGLCGEPGSAGTIPCDQVIAKSNELARRGSEKKGDVVYIGKKLDLDSRLVERCFQSYGRRVTRHAQRGSEETEDIIEKAEESEREEPAREEDQGFVEPIGTPLPDERGKAPKGKAWRDGDRWKDADKWRDRDIWRDGQ